MNARLSFVTALVVGFVLISLVSARSLRAADAPASFSEGQAVEVREGDEWSPATVVKKEGRKYQIKYGDGTEEWVASDRVRKGGAVGAPATPKPDPAKPATPNTEKPAAPDPVKPGTPKPAPAKAKKPPMTVNIGDSIETKWGGMWRKSVVKNKAPSGWILVVYDKSFFEWVEPWRIRKVGSTDDLIPYSQPRTSLKIKPAPKERPADPPAPTGAAADAAKQQEERAAALKDDSTYKEADWSAADQLDLIAGGDWKLVPDPSSLAKLPARAAALKGAGTEFFDRMNAVYIGRGEKPIAIVAHSAVAGRENDLKIEKVDLLNSKSAGVYKFDKGLAALDVSPEGNRILLRSSVWGWGKSDRLELWSIDGATPQKVLTTIPYAGDNDQQRDITAGMFIDDGHAITVSAGGKLAMWDLPACKAVYTVKLQAGTVPALSPGGKQLALTTGRLIVIIDPKTGKAIAEIPDDRNSSPALSFSPTGKQLAAASGDSVCSWDLTTGKPLSEFTVKSPGPGIRMVADNYALVGGSTLVDMSLRISLWKYELNDIPVAVARTGQVFFAVKDGRRNGAALLSSIQLPHAAALAQAKQLAGADLMLLKPGVKVSIQVNITGTAEERQKVEAHIKKELANNNITVADGQPIRIVASTMPGDTVEREYRRFGAFGTQKVNVQQHKARMAVEADGGTAWEAIVVSDPGFMLMMKENQTIEQAVAEASKPNIGFLQTVRLPAYLAKPRDPAWYGVSKLSGTGPEDLPATPAVPAKTPAPVGI